VTHDVETAAGVEFDAAMEFFVAVIRRREPQRVMLLVHPCHGFNSAAVNSSFGDRQQKWFQMIR
jgi:hypothetical protein